MHFRNVAQDTHIIRHLSMVNTSYADEPHFVSLEMNKNAQFFLEMIKKVLR